MYIPPRKTLTRASGITLSYLEWKESSQETTALLLLHGMADHALVWLSLGNALAHPNNPSQNHAQNYHIVTPLMYYDTCAEEWLTQSEVVAFS